MPTRSAFPDDLNWTLLQTFLVIAEERSLSRAAQRLNLTPSAVSHGLKRLEEQTGVRLVERGHRRFTLTGHGVELHNAASDIRKRINALGSALEREDHAVSGTVRLLVLGTLVSESFDLYLAQFRQRYPLVNLNLEMLLSSAALKRLESNEPALGLALCRGETGNIRRELLVPQRYALFCGRHHPLFTQERVTRRDLLAQDFVTFYSDQLGDSLAPLAIFRDRGKFTGRIAATANCQDEVKRLIYAGYGIGCLAEDSARQDVLEGKLRRLPPEKGIADIPVYLAWSRERNLKTVERVFMKGLLAAFGRQDAASGI